VRKENSDAGVLQTAWLTVAEAAEHVRAKEQRIIRQAIKTGDLPAYAYGEVQIRLKANEVDV
jgi:excisionase family DNA binding protein